MHNTSADHLVSELCQGVPHTSHWGVLQHIGVQGCLPTKLVCDACKASKQAEHHPSEERGGAGPAAHLAVLW